MGGVVLDLCCGTGMMTLELAKRASLVYAVDFNEDFVKRIPIKENIIPIVSDAKDFFTPKIKFDLITIFGAIQYNTGADVRLIYRHCNEMLKEGGILIVSGQWGVEECVVVDTYSEEAGGHYFAEYRTLEQEMKSLGDIGFSVETKQILPDRFNRFTNTKFMGIVATKQGI